MSFAVRYERPDVQDRVARDYVVGMLSGPARRRCDTLRRLIPALDTRIRHWEAQLQPMADAVPEIAPRQRVWQHIETTIEPVGRDRPVSLWNRLSFLRGLALASSLAAVALVFVQVWSPATTNIDYVAVLAGAEGQAQFVVTASDTTRRMDIEVYGEALPAGADYQLWAVSKTDGEVRSLGLLDTTAASNRALNETDWRLIGDAYELLVTAETKGGSVIGEPSDDVISRGLCIRLSAG